MPVKTLRRTGGSACPNSLDWLNFKRSARHVDMPVMRKTLQRTQMLTMESIVPVVDTNSPGELLLLTLMLLEIKDSKRNMLMPINPFAEKHDNPQDFIPRDKDKCSARLLYDVKDPDSNATGQIIWGDAFEALDLLDDESIDLIFCSPPPFLSFNVYIAGGEVVTDPRTLGLETEESKYIAHLVAIFDRAKRVLKKTGHVWIHMQDRDDFYTSMMKGLPEWFYNEMTTKHDWYAPEKPIWHKTEKSERSNLRHLKRNWDPIYHFVKDPDIYKFNETGHPYGNSSVFSHPFDFNKEQSRNVESGFPDQIIEVAIRTCLSPRDERETVMDPFAGTGTTGIVAMEMNKSFILMDIFERRVHAMAGRLFKGRT